ncbi:hypothetical protein JCM3774_002685 [Rhodotorula dairenensis]
MPSLVPSKAASSSRRPTSHFRVQTAAGAPVDAPDDAALRDTIALLDRFALSTLTRAAATTAPSVLSFKLAVIERLASPFPDPAAAAASSGGGGGGMSRAVRGETTELMRRALKVLDPSDWDDLVDERWAAESCGFAACGDVDEDGGGGGGARRAQKPREVYVPREERHARNARLRNVRLRGGSLVHKNLSYHDGAKSASSSSADPGAFCSDRCRIRSEYYRSLAGRGREPDRSEMWDGEVERRRAQVSASTEALLRRRQAGEVEAEEVGAPLARSTSAAPRATPADRMPAAATTSRTTTASPSSSFGSATSPIAISNLQILPTSLSIHEKPIKTDGPRPEAPSLLAGDANRDLESRRRQPSLPSPAPSTMRPPAIIPGETDSGPIFAAAAPTTTTSSSSSSSQGAYGLPPIRFLTRPREVSFPTSRSPPSSSSTGARPPSEAHKDDDEEEDEFANGPVLEGIDDEHVRWLELALLERATAERT